MLKRLHLRNFTVFADAEFEFGEGLNVLVGTNGTGKTHVLKVGYTMLYILSSEAQKRVMEIQGNKHALILEASVAKIIKVFQPVPLIAKELIRRGNTDNMAKLELDLANSNINIEGHLTITSTHQKARAIILPAKSTQIELNTDALPVFIPAKEVLTIGWLLPIHNLREVPIDETYPDLLRLLSILPLRSLNYESDKILTQLSRIIGGKVEEEGGRYFLSASDQPRLEMNLVAEGMRKFATLYKLLANGTLTPETTLFWDEPEANLNPALLKELAAVLTDLAQAGFQIILATHSLFLMKELHILSRQRKQPVRYFGLYAGEQGDVQVERQDDFMQLQHIAALDAELTQTFDFEEALDQDYAADS